MFKVNYKNTQSDINDISSCVSIVDFEQVIVIWVVLKELHKKEVSH